MVSGAMTKFLLALFGGKTEIPATARGFLRALPASP
jgi:hypothetical protein